MSSSRSRDPGDQHIQVDQWQVGFRVGRKKIPLGAVVVDDAHACLTTASEQFSIRITDQSIRDDLLSLFQDDLKAQSASGLLDKPAIRRQSWPCRIGHGSRNRMTCWPFCTPTAKVQN